MDRLGKESDAQLAREFDKGSTTIRDIRRQLNIPPFKPAPNVFNWTPEVEKLLGTKKDTDVAEQLGIHKAAVGYHRQKLGIGPFVPEELPDGAPRTVHSWTEQEIQLLGTMHDTKLALQLGLPHTVVTYQRKKLGIMPFKPIDRVVWTRKMLQDLGQMTDSEYAEHHCISSGTIRLKRMTLGIPPYGEAVPEPWPNLPPKAIALLGKEFDVKIAEDFQISRIKVRELRVLMGIPALKPPVITHFDWNAESEALLGTDSDANIGRILKIPSKQVQFRRDKLGIPPYGKGNKVEWTQEKIELLGKFPDHHLANLFHVPQGLITKKRAELGIPGAPSKLRWEEWQIRLLGTLPDKELAAKIGISHSAVRGKRIELGISAFQKIKKTEWTKKWLRRVGKVPDEVLAKQMGISPAVVRKKRIGLNLPVATYHKGVWVKKGTLELLGQKSDGAVARELGVTPSAVRQKRNSMGIPAYKSSGT